MMIHDYSCSGVAWLLLSWIPDGCFNHFGHVKSRPLSVWLIGLKIRAQPEPQTAWFGRLDCKSHLNWGFSGQYVGLVWPKFFVFVQQIWGGLA